jgi:hypothetical protein
MARLRTLAAGALFLFGTTFLWLIPSFLGAATEVEAIGASIGTVVLVVWWMAVSSVSGVTNMAANLALHAIGIAVLLLLLVPSPGRGLDRRLTGHPRQGT